MYLCHVSMPFVIKFLNLCQFLDLFPKLWYF